jgi:hypothetical protein
MFTWLQPRGKLTHAARAPIVADLFFGGLNAVQIPEAESSAAAAAAPRVRARRA